MTAVRRFSGYNHILIEQLGQHTRCFIRRQGGTKEIFGYLDLFNIDQLTAGTLPPFESPQSTQHQLAWTDIYFYSADGHTFYVLCKENDTMAKGKNWLSFSMTNIPEPDSLCRIYYDDEHAHLLTPLQDPEATLFEPPKKNHIVRTFERMSPKETEALINAIHKKTYTVMPWQHPLEPEKLYQVVGQRDSYIVVTRQACHFEVHLREQGQWENLPIKQNGLNLDDSQIVVDFTADCPYAQLYCPLTPDNTHKKQYAGTFHNYRAGDPRLLPRNGAHVTLQELDTNNFDFTDIGFEITPQCAVVTPMGTTNPPDCQPRRAGAIY